jgi:hypothetical protein
MSYRNDHDAALLRVDALEADNARLAAENAKLRAGETVAPPEPSHSKKPELGVEQRADKSLLGVIAAIVIAGLAIFAIGLSGESAPMPKPQKPAYYPRVITFDAAYDNSTTTQLINERYP